jgi:hypothetical protein
MSQTGEDTRSRVNFLATGSERCFIVHRGYCIIVSRAVNELPWLSADGEISGNEEPGVMLPGHCFTIEVGETGGVSEW